MIQKTGESPFFYLMIILFIAQNGNTKTFAVFIHLKNRNLP